MDGTRDFRDFTAYGGVDRRIGWRAPVVGVQLEWVLPRRRVFGVGVGSPRTAIGPVVDVSLTGAAVLGPASLPFGVGDVALLRHEGADSTVVIRRRARTGDPETDLFGVELGAVHPTLMRLIDSRIVEARARVQAPPVAPAVGALFEF